VQGAFVFLVHRKIGRLEVLLYKVIIKLICLNGEGYFRQKFSEGIIYTLNGDWGWKQDEIKVLCLIMSPARGDIEVELSEVLFGI